MVAVVGEGPVDGLVHHLPAVPVEVVLLQQLRAAPRGPHAGVNGSVHLRRFGRRGIQRGTDSRYARYSAPNRSSRVRSSCRIKRFAGIPSRKTTKTAPGEPMTRATPRTARKCEPAMGFRVQAYGPEVTSRRGGSLGV